MQEGGVRGRGRKGRKGNEREREAAVRELRRDVAMSPPTQNKYNHK